MNKRTQQDSPTGLNDWVEVFRAGTHTASDGSTHEFSTADLDQMVESHASGWKAPIVVGHPKHNDPAFGWADQLKRVGNSLYAKFKDVAPEFAASVEAGHYRNRSVRVVKDAGRWLIDHVGFLGAKRPAIPLDSLSYSATDGVCIDFSADEWRVPSLLARMMRRMREFLIDKYGQEDADRVMPAWEVDDLADLATEQRIEDRPAAPSFSAPTQQGDVSMLTEEDLKRAREEARAEARAEAQAEFTAQQTTLQQQLQTERESRLRAEFSANVTEAIDAGRLTPAQAEGAVDFMLQLSREPMEFEFSAGEGDKATKVTKPALTWFRDFMAALPKQIDLGGSRAGEEVDAAAGDAEFAAPEGYAVDADSMAIHGKAVAYQKKHGCSYNEAVDAVSAGR